MIKKILSMALAMLAVCGASALAQQPSQGDKMYRPSKFTDFAFEGVLLTVDQQAKVDSINAVFFGECDQQGQCPQAQQCPRQGQKCDRQGQCPQVQQCPRQGQECDRQGQCPQAQQCSRQGQKCDRQGRCPEMQQCADSARCQSQDGCQRQRRHQGQRRCMLPIGDYTQAVKEVLTPEQYVTFLENIVTAPQPQQPRRCQQEGPAMRKGHAQPTGRMRSAGQAPAPQPRQRR